MKTSFPNCIVAICIALTCVASAQADTITFSGADWTAANHGRTYIGGGGDLGWTVYDDGLNTNTSRQQWLWMDASAALASIPTFHVVTSATLDFAGVRDLDNDGAAVNYGVFEVVGADRGRAAITAVGPTAGHEGDDVIDYYAANTSYGNVTGVTNTFAPQSFDITALVSGWADGSLTDNPGQMNVLWDSRGGSRNYLRWGNEESDNAEVAVGNRPVLTIETKETLHLTNGSFESPDTGSVGGIPDDWTGVSFSGGTVQEGIGGFPDPGAGDAPDGEQWLFLNNGGGVTQRIGAIEDGFGVGYSFTQFEQTNIANGSGVQIELWDGDPNGGGTLLDLEAFAATGTGIALLREGLLDTMGSQTDLYILLRAIEDFGTVGTQNSNVSIDNLQIAAVPAPAALPAGLAMIGLIAARRRRK